MTNELIMQPFTCRTSVGAFVKTSGKVYVTSQFGMVPRRRAAYHKLLSLTIMRGTSATHRSAGDFAPRSIPHKCATNYLEHLVL